MNIEYSRNNCLKRQRLPGRRRVNIVLYSDILPNADEKAKAAILIYNTSKFANILVVIGTRLTVSTALEAIRILVISIKEENLKLYTI